ncbi:transglutaminase domain-containing protein [Pumilibacter intestinalis]|uniref:transglutaminase domain-containing protein n=1 Tax=Pumilibacter intestinalis TaxID=2941511 RepID=UPI00203C9F87|nr:transglutaminase domain-containing protein [Pumilibacter intestinalis]
MKSNTKSPLRVAVVFLLAAVLVLGTKLAFSANANAADSANVGETYYYEELKNSDMAQRLYRAINDMTENANFASGMLEYDLIGSGALTEEEVRKYVDSSSPRVPVALGAARDAFYMDNPDLFWLDSYKLYLSAGMQNGVYAAYLGTGNFENYYVDNTVKSASEVKTATEKYNAALEKAVAEVKKAGNDPVALVKAANKYIAEKTEYDYGARKNAQGGVDYDGYVNTAYGSLVNGKALCGGYARAFKAIMDELSIPCTLVQGSAYSGVAAEGTAGYEAHMWNAVKIGGHWYGVDVTYNSSSLNIDRYTLVGEEFLSQNHYADGVISSSGFELKYPALRALNYGVNEDASGFEFKDEGNIGDKKFGYVDVNNKKVLYLGISYEGKNADDLRKEGKYLVLRYIKEDGTTSLWFNENSFLNANSGTYNECVGKYLYFYAKPDVFMVQFAIVDIAGEQNNFLFDEATFNQHVIATSSVYANNAYKTFKASPYAKKIVPYETGVIWSFDKMDVMFEYNEKLIPANEQDLTDDFKVQIAVNGNSGDMSKTTKIENVKWDAEKNTLSFTFTPDASYAHNFDTYTFVPTNLVGKDSNKTPEPAGYYTFKRKQVVCPKVFNDGRLYMQVYGHPKFVGAEDLSTEGFKDKNGKPIVGNQRSQMMLVVDEPGKDKSETMENTLLGNTEIGVNKTDIKSSSTYEIDLQLCGVVQKVPTGSYMQVGFGFPEGYGPNKDVTFTVYHYKLNDEGVIIGVEKVPCVITEYGIIATVNSFSPFMVCALDGKNADTGVRSIYASVEGKGGSISETSVKQLVSGQTVTYKITPDEGYEIGRVMLGDTDKKTSVNENGEITLGYDDISANSTLEISFVAKRVATERANIGFVVASPRLVVSSEDMIVAVEHKVGELPEEESNTALVVTLIIVFVLIAGAAAFLVWYFLRKKDGGKGKPSSDKNGGAKRAESQQSRASASVRPAMATATATATQRPATAATQRPATAATRPATAAQRPAATATQRPAATATQRPAATAAQRPATAATRPAPRQSAVAPKKPDGKK